MKLTLVHLFPRLMNIYGDRGNVITLQKRASWRGIDIEVLDVNEQADFDLISQGDIFFFGGGQDHDQMKVWEIIKQDQAHLTQLLQQKIDANAVFLLICGGYQLFGNYFLDAQGRHIPGLGLLDITTVAPGPAVKERCIGNILIETDLPLDPKTLVGFENHGGQTTLGTQAGHLGKVIKGFGDNVRDGVEGCIYKQVYGCYMHGSLLPKNPHFADFLLVQALKSQQQKVTLDPLNDELEWRAHFAMRDRLLS